MRPSVVPPAFATLFALSLMVPAEAQVRAAAPAPAATPGAPAPFPSSPGIRRIGHSPRVTTTPEGERIATATNSDLAFWGGYAFQGSYDGFRVIDISDPRNPKDVSQVRCGGSQGDVMVWNKILIRATDQVRSIPGNDPMHACEGLPAGPSDLTFRGLQIFQADDWSKVTAANLVGAVKLECGTHTHTMVPDLQKNRLIVYSSGGCNVGPPGRIVAVEIPIDSPQVARVVNNNISASERGCHDVFVNTAFKRLIGACRPNSVVWDITDPVNPVELYQVSHPEVGGWHSAAITYDGKILAMGWEPGGGSRPRCMATGTPLPDGQPGQFQNEAMKAIFFFDAEDGKFINWYVLPRPQTAVEACTIHNYNMIPIPGRHLLVHGSYQSGTAIVDFTDPNKPKELVWVDPAPGLGRIWSSYWYGGYIYESDMLNGLNVYQVDNAIVSGALSVPHLNPQTQEMAVY
ncbi:MAG: hypothetical protein HY700_03455 [Gemmatimonadetes bacterium]|nr:hypothetical protein [Gemmatimonadota bacterium]